MPLTSWIKDWFGSPYYEMLYAHRDEQEANQLINSLCKELGLRSNSRVLDAGCGKGRHARILDQKGFSVTGIDICEPAIEYAQQAGPENIEYYVHDQRNLFRSNYYDAVLSLFTSFGYFPDDHNNKKVLRSLAQNLKSGGFFVLDFMNVKKEAQNLCPKDECNVDGMNFKIERSFDGTFVHKQIEVFDRDKKFNFAEKVKAYTQKELSGMLAESKIHVNKVFGDYMLNAFDPESSDRLILIGTKQ